MRSCCPAPVRCTAVSQRAGPSRRSHASPRTAEAPKAQGLEPQALPRCPLNAAHPSGLIHPLLLPADALTGQQMDQLIRLDDIRSVTRAHVRKVDQMRVFEVRLARACRRGRGGRVAGRERSVGSCACQRRSLLMHQHPFLPACCGATVLVLVLPHDTGQSYGRASST